MHTMMKRFSASGERVRLACWLRCPAATNFKKMNQETRNSGRIRVDSWLQLALRRVASSDLGRADQRNNLAFIPAVTAKILIGCDHAVVWIKLAHPDQTKICQIGLSIRVALG